ncbi:TPA: hypothetical protein NOT47_002000, partial [Pseudomonas aeruginosa]|nr:hypothetical protein [Pseudomonas aeruginosa]
EDAEGRDTGCDVSIVEYAEKAADLFEQHDRIVGALRAEIAMLRSYESEWELLLNEHEQQRDAAMARVAELEAKLVRVTELERQEPVSTEHLPMHIAYARAKREVFLGACQEDVFRFALIDLLQEFPLYAAPVAQAQHSVPELLEWAVDRWHAEVSLRPLINVHRRALDDTWRQVIRHLGGDTGLLCGPSHDELLAAAPGKEVGHE